MLYLEMKSTDLSKFPHLHATGKGRLVRLTDGVVFGYVKTKWDGVKGIGAHTTKGHTFHYTGTDGTYIVRGTLAEIKKELHI